MTLPQWLPAAVGWATMSLAVMLGVGRLTIWAVVWVEGRDWSRLRHRWQHWQQTNRGEVVTWWGRDGRLMIGFVCDECGVVTGVHECAPDSAGRPKV